MREQQPVPLVQGMPSWVQPPAPVPPVAMHMPAPPSVELQLALQQSRFV
jgi:hypothetical protein